MKTKVETPKKVIREIIVIPRKNNSFDAALINLGIRLLPDTCVKETK